MLLLAPEKRVCERMWEAFASVACVWWPSRILTLTLTRWSNPNPNQVALSRVCRVLEMVRDGWRWSNPNPNQVAVPNPAHPPARVALQHEVQPAGTRDLRGAQGAPGMICYLVITPSDLRGAQGAAAAARASNLDPSPNPSL